MSKKSFISWILLLILPFVLSAQTTRIRGRVLDASTGEGIPYAIVYFDGTLIGTSCDPSGAYTIQAAEGSGICTLTAEASGYENRTLEVDTGSDKVLDFHLLRTGEKEEAGHGK